MENLSLALLGILSGIASALFGIGGGTIIVPTLLLAKFDITSAIGISIFQMIFASFFGSYLNYRKQLISVDLGIALGIGGLIGSSLSGIILSIASDFILHISFLGFTLASFIKYFFFPKQHYASKPFCALRTYPLLALFGCIVGIFSSSLGVGGGLLLAPLLGTYLGLNSKEVVPLALFFICFSSLSGATSLYLAGFLHLQNGIIVGFFSMIGVYFGVCLMQKIQPNLHKKILFGIYIFSISSTLFKIF
ncbi:sulfite exporter TauE/SafE family protein [Helicobacter kayseriensis]|uniref:sulfite exporter TauE/SafE family protein n=1 Tax=Helicobacter kayseriensis TaxID=2905877 RepID=UPI001E42FD19|nr:sulfite exporter TauE/SafE family protein [Helicobacter kayseriensis]MCE3047055.1 sulfite exporter TauE/SafE family protein [Helicobacter kayseriensis]MCE3048285.1 sulfite exporter TauE/SafE family protein [Helicobacter kayseriensis]